MKRSGRERERPYAPAAEALSFKFRNRNHANSAQTSAGTIGGIKIKASEGIRPDTAMSVRSVERSFTAMGVKSVSIVAAGAISPPDMEAKAYPLTASEVAENAGFLTALSVFRSMREKGLISSDEYDQIHTRIANKSAAVLSDLYR